MRPVPGWKAKVKGLRRPRAQMARLFPVAWLKKGLSVGMDPSALMRSILPSRLERVCEFAPLAFSPTAMYSLSSGPKCMAPPLWLVAEDRGLRSRSTTSLPGLRHVSVRGEAAHPVVDVGRRGRVVDVHPLVRREVGIKGDAQEPALAGGIHGDGDERRGQQRAVLDDPELAALLRHEDPPVRGEGHGGGIADPGGDPGLREPGGQGGGRGGNGRQEWRRHQDGRQNGGRTSGEEGWTHWVVSLPGGRGPPSIGSLVRREPARGPGWR